MQCVAPQSDMQPHLLNSHTSLDTAKDGNWSEAEKALQSFRRNSVDEISRLDKVTGNKNEGLKQRGIKGRASNRCTERIVTMVEGESGKHRVTTVRDRTHGTGMID